MSNFKKRLGIAIYPEKLGYKKTYAYVKLAHEHGFSRIFANLIAVENNAAGLARLQEARQLYKYARDLGFEVIVDVNPNFYKAFNLAPSETAFFAKLNVTGIRLDEDFQGVVEAELSRNKHGLKIELNASPSTDTLVKTLANKAKVANVIACHNFYPLRFTGLSRERFIQLSASFQALGVLVAAFVTLPQSQRGAVGPWLVNEGMPTLEMHRDLPLAEQVWDLLTLDVVDDIIIAQQGATAMQLARVSALLANYEAIKAAELVTLVVDLDEHVTNVERDIALVNRGKSHANRADFNANFVRSTYPRIDYQAEVIAPRRVRKVFKLGDVIIVNDRLGRYKGELHIALREFFDHSGGRNFIGRVAKPDLAKLALIHEQRFSLQETSKKGGVLNE